ncbi:unnamed protein product [Brassica oleracea]|uniref:(rape) hypothetical protein n=1 Tax=Brassica napus TaxID=3708 RepID=A0A816VB57_BRANA|nr:unnamed protein product [Brassica napus]
MLFLVYLEWYGLETELAYVVVVSPFWPLSSRFGYCYAWSLTLDLADFILEFMGAVIACRVVWFFIREYIPRISIGKASSLWGFGWASI